MFGRNLQGNLRLAEGDRLRKNCNKEEILSKFGLLAKHPTTGEPTTSPFVKMSNDYAKQATQMWSQIYAIVKENNAKGHIGLTAQSEAMDRLLKRVK